MKCPNCYGNMEYITDDGTTCYFRCPSCGHIIGKEVEPKEEENTSDKEDKPRS